MYYILVAGRNTLYTRTTEFTFKRRFLLSDTRPPKGGFLLYRGETMNIYIYSDESGVFDYIYNKYYVFAGVIILGDEEHDYWRRKCATVEKDIQNICITRLP